MTYRGEEAIDEHFYVVNQVFSGGDGAVPRGEGLTGIGDWAAAREGQRDAPDDAVDLALQVVRRSG